MSRSRFDHVVDINHTLDECALKSAKSRFVAQIACSRHSDHTVSKLLSKSPWPTDSLFDEEVLVDDPVKPGDNDSSLTRNASPEGPLITEEEQNQHGAGSRKSLFIKLGFCVAGLALGAVLCFTTLGGDNKINQTLAIAVWMATLWLTEIIPLVVTAFLPIVLFPMFGILTSASITAQYANNTIFLFIAGFLMALALQRWNIHRRFSLKILSWCGVNPQTLLLGIMFGTFVLSMFVSNTATALMMVPNALSICQSLEDSSKSSNSQQQRENSRKFSIAVFLGIAYSANVGGMASLLGTPPNLVFQNQFALVFPEAPEMTFALWLAFGFPIAAILFAFIWAYLSFMYLRRVDFSSHIDPGIFKHQYEALGPWSMEQIIVSVLFFVEALLWIFRKDLEFDSFTVRGWASIFPEASFLADATIGMAVVVLLMVIPANAAHMARDAHAYEESQGRPTVLLDWKTANTMPYDILFLFGGGFALAKGFVDSGLSGYLGEELKGLASLSTGGVVFIITTLIIWLTELISNTATSNIMIPIAAALAIALETNPYTFMIPVTSACSCAFALPIATPPNMVVFSTGRLPLAEMNKAGLFLNIISSVVLMLGAYTFIPWVLGESPNEYPEWAVAAAVAADASG